MTVSKDIEAAAARAITRAHGRGKKKTPLAFAQAALRAAAPLMLDAERERIAVAIEAEMSRQPNATVNERAELAAAAWIARTSHSETEAIA